MEGGHKDEAERESGRKGWEKKEGSAGVKPREEASGRGQRGSNVRTKEEMPLECEPEVQG